MSTTREVLFACELIHIESENSIVVRHLSTGEKISLEAGYPPQMKNLLTIGKTHEGRLEIEVKDEGVYGVERRVVFVPTPPEVND